MAKDNKTEPTGKEAVRRRAPKLRISQRAGTGADVRKEFTQRQLALIGTVIMQWNEVEDLLASVFSIVLDMPRSMTDTMLTAVSGQATREDIVRNFIFALKPPADIEVNLRNTVDTLADLRITRDRITHCRMFHVEHRIGEMRDKKNVAQQVIISDEALLGVFARLKIIYLELVAIGKILGEFSLRNRVIYPPGSVPEVKRQTLAIRSGIAELRALQKRRASLPPLPLFPKGPLDPLWTED